MLSHLLRKLRGPAAGLASYPGGWHWCVTPAGAQLFGPAGPDPAAWPGVVVKQNIQRTIRRVDLPNERVFVKECRAGTPRAKAREWLRPAKARLEFENMLELRGRGVTTVEPLAWGAPSRWPGTSVLVTRAADARPFADVLADPLAPTERRRLTERFGEAIARLHDVGVAHPDPHPGNVLVTAAGDFLLMDLHAVTFAAGPLAWPRRRADLTLWNRYFQLRACRADRLRFWRAYHGAGGDAQAREIEADTCRSNLRFWTNRLGRYATDNRDTRSVRGLAGGGFAVREWRPAALAALLSDPDGALVGERWKDSASATVAPFVADLVSSSLPAVMKRFNPKSAVRVLKNALRPSPAWRSWSFGHNLRDRGLPTPRPLLYVARRLLGVPVTSYVACERVPDALELPAAVRSLAARPDRRRVLLAWADRLGRLLRAMHEKEVAHRDLKAANILMAGATVDPTAATPVLIDLVGVTVGRTVPDAVRRRDLARLAASFLASPDMTNAARLTLLRVYLGPVNARSWRDWWRAIAIVVAAKRAKNVRSGRPLA